LIGVPEKYIAKPTHKYDATYDNDNNVNKDNDDDNDYNLISQHFEFSMVTNIVY